MSVSNRALTNFRDAETGEVYPVCWNCEPNPDDMPANGDMIEDEYAICDLCGRALWEIEGECLRGEKSQNELVLDMAFSVVSEKDFDNLEPQEILAAARKRLDDLEKNWDSEAFGLVDVAEC